MNINEIQNNENNKNQLHFYHLFHFYRNKTIEIGVQVIEPSYDYRDGQLYEE